MKQKFIVYIFSLLFISNFGLQLALASVGNMVASRQYAWSNNVGYINFENVTVGDSALSGYAWSANAGFINFSPAMGGVFNDGHGNLSGSAWGEQLGWIDFAQVKINDGKFSGTATGTLAGTITFDCPNYCDVETIWRPAPLPVANVPIAPNFRSGGRATPVILPSVVISPVGLLNSFTPDIVNEVYLAPQPVTLSGEVADNGQNGQAAAIQLVKPLFDIVSEPVKVKVAPGELLPVSVKLSNFGAGKRVDVLLTYAIFNGQGQEIYTTTETVAVETTADFVKNIQIPADTQNGIYTAKTSITYSGQLTPATTQFSFTVERKILGVFQSNFFFYGGILVLLVFLSTWLFYTIIKHYRRSRFAPLDYSNVPHHERTFYEILSDTIMQMRQRVGDDALSIAGNIDGLKIDQKSGRVLSLTKPPARVVAELVSEYEKLLGKRVSFSLRKEKEDL